MKEDVVKFATVSGIDFFVESGAEANRVRCDMGIDKLESVRPDGGVVESLGALEMFGAEGGVDDHPGIMMMLLVMFFECLGTGEDFTGALGAYMDVGNLA